VKHSSSHIAWIVLLVGLVLFAGCEERFPLASLPDPLTGAIVGDTTYLEITPAFEGIGTPSALLIGHDQLMYVADVKNNRIIMMNIAGNILGTRSISQPLSISQDMRLDLLVGGSVVTMNKDTVGALFRIKLAQAKHEIQSAVMDTIWRETARPNRRFVGVAALPDNEFLALRNGPDNSSFVDPDVRVLLFNAKSQFITPLGDMVTRAGSGITDINRPSGITAFPNSRDFILIQHSVGVAYGAIWMTYQRSSDFEGWLPRFDPSKAEQKDVEFVRPNRFVEASAVVVDGRRRDIFIADAALDTIIKFDSRGRFKSESFGYARTGGRMVKPTGLAFFDRTLYVADAVTNRILRFRLSTEFQ